MVRTWYERATRGCAQSEIEPSPVKIESTFARLGNFSGLGPPQAPSLDLRTTPSRGFRRYSLPRRSAVNP